MSKSETFPFLVGRILVADEWSIDLPLTVQQRIEDGQMVLWRPGFTIWLSAWNADDGTTANERKKMLADSASERKFDEKNSRRKGLVFYSYRINEEADDQRVAAFQGFAISDKGHIAMSIYLDDETDAIVADTVLKSAATSAPQLDDPSILSHLCFASNMVLEDRNEVGYMYREEPDSPEDSGWRFFSGQESDKYVNNPNNVQMCPIAFVAEVDDAITPYLNKSNGHYGRVGAKFKKEG